MVPARRRKTDVAALGCAVALPISRNSYVPTTWAGDEAYADAVSVNETQLAVAWWRYCLACAVSDRCLPGIYFGDPNALKTSEVRGLMEPGTSVSEFKKEYDMVNARLSCKHPGRAHAADAQPPITGLLAVGKP